MLKLHHYSDWQRLSGVWAALNRVILPKRHVHRTWEYPWALQELQLLMPAQSVVCVGAMWDSLALFLAQRQDRFVAIDPVSIPMLACWFDDPPPEGCELLSGPAEDVLPRYWGDPVHPNNRIDSIFCISTLEHVENTEARKALWQEMCRVAVRKVVATVDYTVGPRERDDILDETSLADMLGTDAYDEVIGEALPQDQWQPLGIVWTP